MCFVNIMNNVKYLWIGVVGLVLMYAWSHMRGDRYQFLMDDRGHGTGVGVTQHFFMGDKKTGDFYIWVPAQGGDWVRVAQKADGSEGPKSE